MSDGKGSAVHSGPFEDRGFQTLLCSFLAATFVDFGSLYCTMSSLLTSAKYSVALRNENLLQ